MQIRFFPVHPLLREHVSQIWIVENAAGWRTEDIKTIVPNGRMKIVFPYRSGLLNRAVSLDGSSRLPGDRAEPFQNNPKDTLWVLGMSDRPSIVDSEGPIGVLSAELFPGAAFPFFPAELCDFTNRVTPATDVYGSAGRELQDRLAEEPTAEGRVRLLEAFLLGLLRQAQRSGELVRHAVRFIQERGGLLTISELTEKMGYSQRYLAMVFDRFVGLGPKTLAEIVRFQNRFVALTRYASTTDEAAFDEDYYDQSHFSREFKRFAGLPPVAYRRKTNEFMTMFYGGATAAPRAPDSPGAPSSSRR